MEPTLVPGERVLMDSAWYRLSSPKRGDIIAFRTSEDKKASIHIKRVIALPGETVQIKDGQILINGEVYNEKDEFPAITNAGLASEPITVGKGQYFVLGDNRNNSEDSRHNGMGLVDSDRIVGKLCRDGDAKVFCYFVVAIESCLFNNFKVHLACFLLAL